MIRPEDRIGRLLESKYRIDEFIARGGMGLVYGATHRSTGRAVAVKVLPSELAARRDLVQRIAAEGRLGVDAAHPNVVEVLDAGIEAEHVPYLVFERLYGQTLEALLNEPLPLIATAQAVIPIMNALSALHRAGIVHRDIKPSNIFLSQTEFGITPKLLDFGIAKVLSASSWTQSGSILGTPAYMAPEQALGCSSVGAATDVWSMAVVICRCLTGRLPFEDPETYRRVALRHRLNLEESHGIPRPIAAVVQAALALDATERPANMFEFRAKFLHALTQVDSATAWPNEATVGYGHDASALCVRKDRCELPVEDAEGRCGRPLDIATRTLVGNQLRLPRAARKQSLILAATIGFFVLIATAAHYGAKTEGSSDRGKPSALSSIVSVDGFPPRLSPEVDTALSMGAEPTSGKPGANKDLAAGAMSVGEVGERAAAAQPSAKGPGPAPRSNRSAERTFNALPSRRMRSVTAGRDVIEDQPTGANRSPIIE